jgi:nitrogen fixation protein FixH
VSDEFAPSEGSTTPLPAVRPDGPAPTPAGQPPQSDPWDSWYVAPQQPAPPTGPPAPLPPPPAALPPAPLAAPVPNAPPVPDAQNAPEWPWATTTGAMEQQSGAPTDPYAAGNDPYATRADAPPSADPYATRADAAAGANPYAAGTPAGADPYATRVESPATLISTLRQAPQVPRESLYRTPRQQRRSLTPMLIGGAAVVVIALAVILLTNKHSGGNSATGSATTSAAPSSKTPARTTSTAQQQAATALSGLLAQSVTDRGDVIDAVVNVRDCGSKLAHDQAVFTKAASNRQRLLTQLANMSGRSALSAAMLQDLAGAWQASAQADSDLAKWASDELTNGCRKKTVNSDGNLSASYGPDSQATQDKQAFAGLWDSVASKYGLKTYQESQL